MINKKTPRIKTNIKFYKNLDNVEGRFYGFVTKTGNSWRGCRDTEERKKIVFIDPSIAKDIVPNVLYHCSLIPMNNDKGFIVKAATLLKFEGNIITNYREDKNIFTVSVKFGNKLIIYDPSSKEARKRNIQAIAENLRNRLDLQNANEIANEFVNNACIIKRLYQQHLENTKRTPVIKD